MEKSVGNSKFVILVCTPAYAARANNREGGVGYEATIITAELAENINQRKFIPVLRDGDWKSSLPVWIKNKVGVDLRNDPYSEEQYQNLLRALHEAPLKPPPVGPKPVFEDTSVHQKSQPSSKPALIQFFNLDGIKESISVSGRQHSVKDSSLVDLWGLVTIVNYAQLPMNIAPLKLFLSGAEWPVKSFFFRLKSNPLSRFERISLVGNSKEDHELHFMFSASNCPQARSGYLLVETDSGAEPFQVDVNFP